MRKKFHLTGAIALFLILLITFPVFSQVTAPAEEKKNEWKFLSDVNVILFPAFFSSFMEKPSPKSGLNNRIWGDFGTIYAEGSANFEILPFLSWITFHPEVRAGWIMPNKMYFGNESTYVTIGGYVIGFNADLGFRPIYDKYYYLELRVGFVMNTGKKIFFDYSENNVVVNAGLSGYYDFVMFGPEFTLESKCTFIPSIGLGVLLSAFYSPSYENHSTVLNKDGTKSDFAPGYRYGGHALITWNNPNILASLGWKYERIYFTWDYSTHDLDIVYMGPIVQFSFLF